MGLISIYAVVWKYPNAPADVMPEQPAGIALPATQPTGPNTTNPGQPGEVR
jgi:succinate dehydrogenase / fumarate reductase cytochrome b subunit